MTPPEGASVEDSRVIDLWGFLKGLWAEKVVLLSVFAVVLGLGGAYALTRPPVYQVTQSVMISLPAAASSTEAIQQLDALDNVSVALSRLLVRPPVTDKVLASHPEIGSLSELQARVTVLPIGSLMEIQSEGADAVAEAELVSQLAASFSEQLPHLTQGNSPATQFVATVWGEPAVVQVSSGRTILMVGAAALAALVATVAAALRARRP